LRNRIYEAAFAGETVYVYPDEPRNTKHIHLIQICKQIRYEASSLFYTRCIFAMSIERTYVDSRWESRNGAIAIRGLAYLDPVSQVVGLENSAIITILQISRYSDAERRVRAVRNNRRDQRFLAMTVQAGRVEYTDIEERPVPKAHNFSALERVHVRGNGSFTQGIDKAEIEEALCLAFSKRDLVVTFTPED
jgi:hypothetical protein